MYTLKDWQGTLIKGSFYEPELQVLAEEPTKYRIERVVRVKGSGKNKKYFVKWLGFPTSANSWVNSLERV